MNTFRLSIFALSLISTTLVGTVHADQAHQDHVQDEKTQEEIRFERAKKVSEAVKTTQLRKQQEQFFNPFKSVTTTGSLRNTKATNTIKRGSFPYRKATTVQAVNKVRIGNPAYIIRPMGGQKTSPNEQ